MKRLILSVVLLLIAAVPALSETDKETYVEDGTLWEVKKVWYWYQPYHYRYGYWAYYNEYRKVTSVKDPDWRSVLAKYASKIRLNNEEHLSFMESVRALGLEGAGASIYNNYQAQVVPQGQTVYGYSYNSVTDVYGIDLNVLYQQAARLVQNAQDYAAQAHAGHTTAVDRAGERAARAAEILAKAQLLKAVDVPQTRVETKEFRFKVGSDGKVEESVVALSIPSGKCSKCHSGAKLEGKFDINTFHKLDQDGKERVWKRVLNGEMPPKDEPQLTATERKAFFQ